MQNISDNPGFTNREDYLLKVLENAPVGILTFSADWEIDFVNENYSRYGVLYNIDSFSLRGLNILDQDLFPGVSIKEELLGLQQGYSFEKEIRNIPASPQGFLSVFVKGSPVFVEGQFSGGILIIEDIKTIKQSEEDDILFADQVNRIAGKFYDLFLIVDVERKIKYLSGKDYEKFIHQDQLLIDKPLAGIFSKDVLNSLLPAINSSIEKRTIEELNLKIDLLKGKLVYNCRIFPYQTKHRQIKFIYLFFENVTDLQNEVLRLRDEFVLMDAYATASRNIPQPLLTTGIDGEVKFFNDAAV
jgi:PAS domain-containing protein